MLETELQTVAVVVPAMESWSEIRCPACVPLGWMHSRLLFKVTGKVSPTGAKMQVHCHRCKSIVSWTCGLPVLEIVAYGVKNHKKQTAVME